MPKCLYIRYEDWDEEILYDDKNKWKNKVIKQIASVDHDEAEIDVIVKASLDVVKSQIDFILTWKSFQHEEKK